MRSNKANGYHIGMGLVAGGRSAPLAQQPRVHLVPLEDTLLAYELCQLSHPSFPGQCRTLLPAGTIVPDPSATESPILKN